MNIKGQAEEKKRVFANFVVTDGVADIDVWHERLGHVCPDYIRLMVDRGSAKGIKLQRISTSASNAERHTESNSTGTSQK